MREILFRGKNAKGEWEYGNLLIQSNDTSSDYLYQIVPISLHEKVSPFDFVIPETVGQYTGLTDKNGKKIFEGDIVKAETYNGKYYEEVVGTIIYIPAHMAFGIYNEQEREIDIIDTGYHNLEIIGNIHDNPKLLEDMK